jgi:hypothetical protein
MGSGGVAKARYILFIPDRRNIKVTVISALGGTVEATLKLEQGEEQ